MNVTKDGGPAFPVPDSHPGAMQVGTNGMSLRDWFAGQALAGWAAGRSDEEAFMPGKDDGDWEAEACYRYADAMLRARERGQESDGDEAWFAKQPDACVSVANDVVMASSGRHYLASGSTREAALRALRAKVEGGAR